MLNNHTARVHAHGIIADLLSAVIEEVRIPLEVNKLEGDAIFMVAARQDPEWQALGRELGSHLDTFLAAFSRTRSRAPNTSCSPSRRFGS